MLDVRTRSEQLTALNHSISANPLGFWLQQIPIFLNTFIPRFDCEQFEKKCLPSFFGVEVRIISVHACNS